MRGKPESAFGKTTGGEKVGLKSGGKMRYTVRKLSQKFRIPALLLALFFFSIILVSQRVYLVQIGDRITTLESELRSVRMQNDELECEIARYIETKRLVGIAREEFGLRNARLDEVVMLKEPCIQNENGSGGTWEKVRIVARRTWDALLAGAVGTNNCNLSGSI